MIVEYIERSLTLALEEIVFILGPILGLGMIMHFLSEYLSHRLIRLAGYRPYIYLTAVGTAVHELGHAFFCVIFRHKVTNITLFSPRDNGTLGQVSHTYNPASLYQRVGNFFIGTGPILFGPLVIYLLGLWLLGQWVMHPIGMSAQAHIHPHTISGLINMIHRDVVATWYVVIRAIHHESITDLRLWVFAYFVFAIGGHVTLSPQDLRSSREGFVLFIIIILAFNLGLNWIPGLTRTVFGFSMKGAAVTMAVMLAAMVLNLLISIILIVIAGIFNRLFRRM